MVNSERTSYPSAVPVRLSIIVPVYNEEDNILPMAEECAKAMEGAGGVDGKFEVVFVDDASTDATWKKIAEAQKKNPHVVGLRHLKNAGQSAALWTGIQATEAPLIATLDGDLQNDPADIPRMLKELDEVDFVCGMRLNRQDNFIRRTSSMLARKARQWALAADFHDTGCAMRVFRREALEGVFPFNGLHRFLPILVHNGGFKTREIPVNHRARVAGVSKYGIGNRLWRGLADLFAIRWYQRRRTGHIEVEELKGRKVRARKE
ncbi:MAG: dolichol-phosphate mannosyltransferase [Limisphaerales bacterium]